MLIKGHGIPEPNQHGSVGDIYLDVDTNNTYECIEAKSNTLDYGFVDVKVPADQYTWNPLQSIEWIDEIPEGTSFSANGSSSTFFAPLVKTFNIPYGVTTITGGAFTSSWTSLERVNIPDTVTTIEGGVFGGCPAIKELTIPGSVRTIGGGWAPTMLVKLTIEDGLEQIDGGFMCNHQTLQELNLPSTLKTIGAGSLNGCPQLKSITLPEGLETIDGGNGLTGITYLSVPGSVQSIYPGAFAGASALEKLDIQEGVTSIPETIVNQGTALTEVNIPNSVTTIHADAFKTNTALANITIDAAEGSIEGAPWGAPETCTITWLR